MASYTGYHCSPIKNAELVASVARSLCIADSDDAAKSYRRGDSYDAPYYVYEVEISGKICGPKSCDKFCSELGHESLVERGLTYEAMKIPAVRAWFVAEGFDAVRYGDTNDGFDYECCEVFSAAAIVSVKCVEILNEEETEEASEYVGSDAYDTGFEAAAQGEPQSANPYAKGTWDNAAWQAGWDAQ